MQQSFLTLLLLTLPPFHSSSPLLFINHSRTHGRAEKSCKYSGKYFFMGLLSCCSRREYIETAASRGDASERYRCRKQTYRKRVGW
ncbi:hypothetical protein E2C01_036703 [Portunus trituberculatus]|uniref:Secreted protein n=1 Tax=Portunus trituberculatus TaxID=210409 RepID=A0A5B7FCN9_PORTR|nr:hypothetical protein [Portunus trituberculatus]